MAPWGIAGIQLKDDTCGRGITWSLLVSFKGDVDTVILRSCGFKGLGLTRQSNAQNRRERRRVEEKGQGGLCDDCSTVYKLQLNDLMCPSQRAR